MAKRKARAKVAKLAITAEGRDISRWIVPPRIRRWSVDYLMNMEAGVADVGVLLRVWGQ